MHDLRAPSLRSRRRRAQLLYELYGDWAVVENEQDAWLLLIDTAAMLAEAGVLGNAQAMAVATLFGDLLTSSDADLVAVAIALLEHGLVDAAVFEAALEATDSAR